MSPGPTFDELAELLADLRAEPRERITPQTRLGEDLGISGDDWDEVLVAIGKRWPVDWSRFDFYSYFDEEPNWRSLVRAVRDLLTGRRLKPFTVGHLLAVVQRRTWFDPSDAAA